MYLYVLVIYNPLSCSELTACPKSPGPINIVQYKTVLCKLEINILNFVQAKFSVLYLTCMWSHHKYITRVGDTNERSSYTALFSSSWFLFTTCRTGVAASFPPRPTGNKDLVTHLHIVNTPRGFMRHNFGHFYPGWCIIIGRGRLL